MGPGLLLGKADKMRRIRVCTAWNVDHKRAATCSITILDPVSSEDRLPLTLRELGDLCFHYFPRTSMKKLLIVPIESGICVERTDVTFSTPDFYREREEERE